VGKYICEEVCPHVGDLIAQDRYGDFHLIDMLGRLLVCEECWHAYGLQQFANCPNWAESNFEHPNDEVLDAYFEIYERLEGRRVECAECVAAAEVTQSRRDGKPDPFPVFERTLTENRRDVLDRLEAHLIRNFAFKPSIVEHFRKEQAAFVHGGNYRRPLAVTVYYVTVRDDQDRIASLAADFLAAFELNQCLLQFFETEVWTTWFNAETRTSGGYRGKETLLGEIYLNC
jgi:hypothetical protein